jgi:branched-chain amino acid aminotransferase
MAVQGSQGFVEDPRNETVLVYVDGALVPRGEAKVSVFDSGFVLGDGVWEGFRLVNGRLAFVAAHLERLWAGARAIDMDLPFTKADIEAALHRTVAANGMTDGVHLRLMVTRGVKRTPNQDPRYALGRPTVVITAEWKEPGPAIKRDGLVLFTSTVRTTPPDMMDMSLNSHSRLPLILALVQAIKAGAHEALMLDPRGFVASCNATNFFIVRNGEVWTSSGHYCFRGITRGHALALARADGIPAFERDFALADVYTADEAFVTGTYGGITPVRSVDGRDIGATRPGPITQRIDALYRALLARECAAPA